MSTQAMSLKTGSVYEALKVAMPLIIASSGHAIKLFTDRVMLSHYDGLALSASLSAGAIWFALLCFWMGTASYASSFVAQYTGAKRADRVGPAIWQAMFLAIIGGVFVGSGYFWGEYLFRAIGHTGHTEFEITYFKTLCPGAVFFILTNALMSFWNGRGKTWIVTAQEGISTTVNIIVNFVLIFGAAGMTFGEGAEMLHIPGIFDIAPQGIFGAAIGTTAAGFSGFLFAIILFLSKKNRTTFNTLPKKKFDLDLFKRLVKFGMPNGIHFILDVAAFCVFINVLSSMGDITSMASTIAFSINAMAFIPMMGIGMTASIFVGQGVGANNIHLAEKAVRSCRVLMFSYMAIMFTIFIFGAEAVCNLFPLNNISAADTEKTYGQAIVMMQYLAVFLGFDGIAILYNCAIKGAGDTRFSMWLGVAMAWLLFAIPSFVAFKYFDASPWTLWRILVIYMIIASSVFYFRYKNGKWKHMKII